MAMTPQQLQTLKEYIAGQPDLSGEPMNPDGNFNIAAKLNLAASPSAFTWKKIGESNLGQILGSSGYDFTRIDNLSVGKARIWDEVKQTITLNQFTLNLPSHKAAIPAVFTVAGDDGIRLAIFNAMQRFATRFERVFLSGNGATTDKDGVGPLPLVVPGPVTPFEVMQARTLP